MLYLQRTRPCKLLFDPSSPNTAPKTQTGCTTKEEDATSAGVSSLDHLKLANMHIKRDCPKKKGTKKPTEFGPEEPLKKGRRAGKVNNAEGDQGEENQGNAE